MNNFKEQTEQYVDEIKSGANAIMVVVRVRPLNEKQQINSPLQTVKVLDHKLIVLMDPGEQSPTDVLRKNRNKQIQYAFDYVFNQSIRTQRIYDECVSILLDGVMEGYNATIFAFGPTSCGKTYTMVGNNDNSGIMALSIIDLLSRFKQKQKYKHTALKVSYIEIYNENIKDLLISEDKNFQLREDPKDGITIPGITEITINNINQLKTVLKVGNKNRSKESTGANEASSRSHGILKLQVQVKNKAQSTTQETQISRLSLVDLAGSQRASNTTNKGQRMVEGAKINQSLLVLGNCIQALSQAVEKNQKKVFVPYRGSKLTRLLKDSLGGNCRTIMIAHITPAASSFEDTYNTLLYANRAKYIKNNAVRNILNAQTHVSNYVNVINSLKKQNQELKIQINQKQLHKNKSTLPLLQNVAYDEEVQKYEDKIGRQFLTQEKQIRKIHQINIKIEELAFEIFRSELQDKNEGKKVKHKSEEISNLSREKLKLTKIHDDLVQNRSKLMKEIKGNDIIGKVGQPYLLALLKEKKAEVQEKMSNQKSQLYELQKKQMKSFMSNLKKQMKVRDKIIEQQKVLIQKNNIINRITYSQLHAIEEDNSAEKYNKNKSKREEKRNYSPYKNDSPHKNESKQRLNRVRAINYSPLRGAPKRRDMKKIKVSQDYIDQVSEEFEQKRILGSKNSEPVLKIGRKPIKSPPAFDFVFMQR